MKKLVLKGVLYVVACVCLFAVVLGWKDGAPSGLICGVILLNLDVMEHRRKKEAERQDKIWESLAKFMEEMMAERRIEEKRDSEEGGYTECKVHGSIEHMQSVTGKCPGCGK